ncbi:MAG TPA: hypothetical protein VF221_01615 [Chloroflexota bacterium]
MPYWPKCDRCKVRRGQTKRGLCNNCYQRGRRSGDVTSTYVKPDLVRAHIKRLTDRGMALREIARRAGIDASRLHVVMRGRDGRQPAQRIATKTHEAIMSVAVPSSSYQGHPRSLGETAKRAPRNRRGPHKRIPFVQRYVEMRDVLGMTEVAIAEEMGVLLNSLQTQKRRHRDAIELLRRRREWGAQWRGRAR